MLTLDSEPARLIEDAIGADQVLVFRQRPEALRSCRRCSQALAKDSKANEKIGYGKKDKIAQIPDSAIRALTNGNVCGNRC